ncbi:unnamed protein product [Eruca vesicaria subsp. sativa]|uniref:Uncharacterized protein n=1 Tax=Eruca vesicaria subsp. sativa TaxID=29727 RepID=A0ABC8KEV1_ERUVS|nr:unnamed protein product [Eruca vesicaria subsp. sativa]
MEQRLCKDLRSNLEGLTLDNQRKECSEDLGVEGMHVGGSGQFLYSSFFLHVDVGEVKAGVEISIVEVVLEADIVVAEAVKSLGRDVEFYKNIYQTGESVEASLCLSLDKEDLSCNEIEFLKDTSEGCYYRVTLPWRRLRRPVKDLRYRVKSNNLAPRAGPQVIVEIKWDMTNESDGSYSADVTISNYFKDNDRIFSPWKLAWLWTRQETLVSTLGANAKETQHGFISFTDDDNTYCLNNVTFVDLPSQNNGNCKGGVVVPGFRNADVMTDNSTSFQITVSHYNRVYHAQPDVGLEYESRCDTLKRVTNTPDYLSGTVILPRLTKADLAKSSTSFPVSVSHSNRGYRTH